MLSCGIDVGSLTVQIVLLEDETLRASVSLRVEPHPVASAERALAALRERSDADARAAAATLATGYGRQQLVARGLAGAEASEIACHARGASFLMPAVRTVIDVGGQDAKVIRVDAAGELANFVMNDKCASGTGRFLEAMARTLRVELSELGPLAGRASAPIELASRCGIFCETELLHHLQRGARRPELAAGVARAMATRVAALARRLGPLEREVTMSGGVAKNAAVRAELERMLGVPLRACPIDPQLVGALGAALLAAEGGRR